MLGKNQLAFTNLIAYNDANINVFEGSLTGRCSGIG